MKQQEIYHSAGRGLGNCGFQETALTQRMTQAGLSPPHIVPGPALPGASLENIDTEVFWPHA